MLSVAYLVQVIGSIIDAQVALSYRFLLLWVKAVKSFKAFLVNDLRIQT